LKAKQAQDKDTIKELSITMNKLKKEISKLTKEWLRKDLDKLNVDRDEFIDILTRIFIVKKF
jgi:uncharacterized membrane protein (DUF106 family)